jgi:hypothetical protein
LLALAVIVFGAPWRTSHVVSAQDQTLFLSVTDASGDPVTDLTVEGLLVRWDDEDCETLVVEPINWPVRITVFVDNERGGREAIQDMREGLKLFGDAIPAQVEVALATLAGRPRFVTMHTSDREELAHGIDLIVPEAGGIRFRDALVEEADRLNGDEARQYFPVIVMVANGDSPEGSTSQQRAYENMLERMVGNLATVHTRMLMNSRRGAFSAGNQVQVGINLSEVTGGTYESMAISTAFRTMLPELGRDIARKHRLVSNQYRVTYAPPDSISNPSAVQIVTNRSGINLVATLDGNVP